MIVPDVTPQELEARLAATAAYLRLFNAQLDAALAYVRRVKEPEPVILRSLLGLPDVPPQV